MIGYTLVNGLSNYDAQIITINNNTVDKCISKTQSIRKFNNFSISQFAINVSYENWDNVFIGDDVNTVLTIDTHLRISKSSFPLQKMYSAPNNKPRITTGIKTSCHPKRWR
jgi:hypothetical protein